MENRNALGLTGNQLKLLAIVLMTIDHIGAYLLPQHIILRYIGRLAMPIFAYMIAEGCRYTRNKKKYLLTMAGFATVRQIVYFIFQNSVTQCILVTFCFSIVLILLLERANQRKDLLSLCLLSVAFVGMLFVCSILPRLLPETDFRVDYGFCGVLLPVLIYMGRTKEEKLLMAAIGLTVLAMNSSSVQWYALLSVPLLALYNGKRGKANLKYLFYIYYPAHLAALYGVALLIK